MLNHWRHSRSFSDYSRTIEIVIGENSTCNDTTTFNLPIELFHGNEYGKKNQSKNKINYVNNLRENVKNANDGALNHSINTF